MKRQEAEKLAIKLGCYHFEPGDDGFGGEDVPRESVVNVLMGYISAPPNCPACGKQTESQHACMNNSCPQSSCDSSEGTIAKNFENCPCMYEVLENGEVIRHHDEHCKFGAAQPGDDKQEGRKS